MGIKTKYLIIGLDVNWRWNQYILRVRAHKILAHLTAWFLSWWGFVSTCIDTDSFLCLFSNPIYAPSTYTAKAFGESCHLRHSKKLTTEFPGKVISSPSFHSLSKFYIWYSLNSLNLVALCLLIFFKLKATLQSCYKYHSGDEGNLTGTSITSFILEMRLIWLSRREVLSSPHFLKVSCTAGRDGLPTWEGHSPGTAARRLFSLTPDPHTRGLEWPRWQQWKRNC